MAAQLSLFPDDTPGLRDIADIVKLEGIEGLPGAIRRADDVRYQHVRVKAALSKAVGMPFAWALNPYRGCTHGCEYCYARKYQRHLELGAGDDFSSFILIKTNVAERLSLEVRRPSWRRETVAIGTATDPYQPIEGRYQLTRRCLQVLSDAASPFSIVTKGPMVVRDLDILQEATRRAGCSVTMSVPSVDEDVWQTLEPGTASPRQRLRAIGELARGGIDAGVFMAPLLPGISTSRGALARTLSAIADSGARLVGSGIAHLEPGVRDHFLGVLARDYPQLVEGYERLYRRPYAPPAYVAAVKDVVGRLRATFGARLGLRSGPAGPSAPPPAARWAGGSRRGPSSTVRRTAP